VSYIYFGAPIEIILRFAYIATFMWTLVFAVDTYHRARTKKAPNSAYYHVFVWIVSAVLAGSHPVIVFVGIGTRCADKYRLIGSYFLLYLPMLVVMIVNPILYFRTKRSYEQRHREGGRIAAEDRKKMKDHNVMFFVYMVIFYFCWAPSLVNLVFSIITPFVDSVSSVPFPIWMWNAIANPLQGFLNCLSYGRSGKSIFTDRRQSSTAIFSESNEEKDSLV
jgi:ocular albinism type 1 protein